MAKLAADGWSAEPAVGGKSTWKPQESTQGWSPEDRQGTNAMDKPATPKDILVVDDDEDLRELLGTMLESEGYSIRLAASGEAALREVTTNSPDLILLDLMMPGIDGWGVIEGLKERGTPPPVIVMSGLPQADALRRGAVSRHISGYLSKPFAHDVLLRTCDGVLRAAEESPGPELTNRRQQPRRDLVMQGTLLSKRGTPMALGQILNLSRGGAHLDLGAQLQPGTEVALWFEIPGIQEPFRLSGRIRWCRDSKVGLTFGDLTPEEESNLQRLVEPTE